MRYRMKQQAWSLTERFTITNAVDEPVGYIDGAVKLFGRQLSFTDVTGHEVARIEQKGLQLRPVFEINRDGHLCALVYPEMFKLTPTFTVDVPGPDDLRVEGDLFAHEYFFVRGGKTVAAVSRKWWTIADTFGVDVLEDEDHVLILASTVVVDLVHHDAERRS